MMQVSTNKCKGLTRNSVEMKNEDVTCPANADGLISAKSYRPMNLSTHRVLSTASMHSALPVLAVVVSMIVHNCFLEYDDPPEKKWKFVPPG